MPRKWFPNKNSFRLLIIILIIGALFRFYGLEIQSLWTDELASWKISSNDTLAELIHETIYHDTYPPAYYILLHFVIKYIGNSETILRLPSAIGGLLSILGIYLLGLRLYSYKEGLVAAALMTILWYPIYYSQEARTYIFLLLFTLLSTYNWVNILKKLYIDEKPEKKDIFWYILFGSLNCYFHYFGVYFIFLQGFATIFLCLKKKNVRYNAFLMYFILFLIYCPWIPALFEHFGSEGAVSKQRSLLYFVKIIGTMFNASKSPFIALKSYSRMDILISSIIIVVIFGCILFYMIPQILNFYQKKNYKNFFHFFIDSDILLLLWLIIPFLGIIILHKLTNRYLEYRYFAFILPSAYLLFSRSIIKIFSTTKKQVIATTVFMIIFAFHLVFYLQYYSKPIKEQYREAISFVIRNKGINKDSTIVGYAFDNLLDYYALKKKYEKKIFLNIDDEKDYLTIIDQLEKIKTRYVWLIIAHHTPQKEYMEYFANQYKITVKKAFIETEVILFEKL